MKIIFASLFCTGLGALFWGPLEPILGSNGLPLANTMPSGGNLGRNTLRGPGFVNFNLGLVESIHTWESQQLRLRVDLLNAFNNRDWGNPVATMNSPNFGKNLNKPTPQTVTLSVKYSF